MDEFVVWVVSLMAWTVVVGAAMLGVLWAVGPVSDTTGGFVGLGCGVVAVAGSFATTLVVLDG